MLLSVIEIQHDRGVWAKLQKTLKPDVRRVVVTVLTALMAVALVAVELRAAFTGQHASR